MTKETKNSNSTRPVRVRFAPSPTGMLHIGGARTAIYNWAFARANNGKFILRIEDTDAARSTDENTQIILRALSWLGLDWDEGPVLDSDNDSMGDFGPYFQTQRANTYEDALERLMELENVYPCFCTKEELDEKREKSQADNGGYGGYDKTCRCLDTETVNNRILNGDAHVWRLKVPENRGNIEFVDEVYGELSFPADVMDDMILVRSDGSATYNFAVVCDDANMKISHVIRGDDHLSNTPRQILIYEALGIKPPKFAHLSMILGADGKKLSKRHGATNVEQYQENGFLPDAMVNYLALLGWSLDGETTEIPKEVLCREFSLSRVTKKDAVFDEAKLSWLNSVYIKNMSAGDWVSQSMPWLVQAGASKQEIIDNPAKFEAMYPLLQERLVTLNEAGEKLEYMFWGANVTLDEKSVEKVLLKEGARADEVLKATRDIFANESIAWECDALQNEVKTLCEKLDMKAKFVFQPVRVAICGNMVSPPLFESIELLNRNDMIARLDHCLKTVF